MHKEIMKTMLIVQIEKQLPHKHPSEKYRVVWEGLSVQMCSEVKSTKTMKWEDTDQTTWTVDGRGSLIKDKQDKRSPNQSKNCLFSKMRYNGILSMKDVVVIWEKKKNP